MELKRISHAVYDTKYHLVWVPKYRKLILRRDIRVRIKEIFKEISNNHDFEIDTLEVAEDHVHIFLSFPPRHSISKVVGNQCSVIFQENPEVKEELWGGEFWEDGYFVRTVGDKVTKEVISKYIKYHREHLEIS